MNYKNLAKQIIDVARGKHSYLELSEKMGHSYDKVGKWVRGTREINWNEFVPFADLLGIQLAKAIKETIHMKKDCTDSVQIAEFLMADRSIAGAAKDIGLQSNRLRRILNGADARLSEILQMIDKTYPTRINVFVELLVGNRLDEITELVEETTLSKRYKDLAVEDISYSIAMKLFTLNEYIAFPSHKSGYIAEKLGVSLKREEEIIKRLMDEGFIIFENDHYTPVNFSLVQCSRQEKYQIVSNFHQLGIEGLLSGEDILDNNIYSSQDLVVSEECHQQIIKKLQSTFYEITMMAHECRKKRTREKICHLNLQLYSPTEIIKKRKS